MKSFLIALTGVFCMNCYAQQIPAPEENIPYLVTFAKDGVKSWGDDDFSQTWFFVVPKYQVKPVYLRIFDPETGGELDEKKVEFNSKTQYSIYGGKTCFTTKDVRDNKPTGNYKSGNLLYTKTFGSNEIYDGEWYTFGPFNPKEGEFVNEYGGYIFKVIAEGISGDDGNLYTYFLSESPVENKPVEGGNAFTFEYTFRLSDKPDNVAHLYPFIEENVISVKISNFDFDNDGNVNIISIAKKKELSNSSGDNIWATSEHKIIEQEKKTTLDVQFLKSKTKVIKNNNVTLFVTNQYGDMLPIYTMPIGGSPNSNYKVQFNQKKKTTTY
ncbi:MAG: hypothetical protein K0Q95_3132 [Bacteroidota bacterium]|jgi:hypothetical protein|nr:hypothetical protein [Bacteroidota bacterium]